MPNPNAAETGLVQVRTTIEAADWVARRDALVAAAKAVVSVDDNAAFERTGELLAKGGKLVRELEAERKRVTAPLDEIKKSVMAREKALRRDLESEVGRLKTLASGYATEQARLAEEERRRIEEAERRAAEAQVAADAARASDPFGFNAPATPPAAPAPLVPAPTVQRAHSAANRVVERWTFEVTDASAVPRELLSVDDAKVRAFLNAKKAEGYRADQLVVPGLRISATMQVCGR